MVPVVELIDLSELDFDASLPCESLHQGTNSQGEPTGFIPCGVPAKYLAKINHCVPFELVLCEWCANGLWDCRVCDAKDIGSPIIKGTI